MQTARKSSGGGLAPRKQPPASASDPPTVENEAEGREKRERVVDEAPSEAVETEDLTRCGCCTKSLTDATGLHVPLLLPCGDTCCSNCVTHYISECHICNAEIGPIEALAPNKLAMELLKSIAAKCSITGSKRNSSHLCSADELLAMSVKRKEIEADKVGAAAEESPRQKSSSKLEREVNELRRALEAAQEVVTSFDTQITVLDFFEEFTLEHKDARRLHSSIRAEFRLKEALLMAPHALDTRILATGDQSHAQATAPDTSNCLFRST